MASQSLVILAHRDDCGSSRLIAQLRSLGSTNVLVVSDADLATSARFQHRPATSPLEPGGGRGDRVWLKGELELSVDTVGCLYSRLVTVQPPRFPKTCDREYASSELYALVASWLAGMGEVVVNRASPLGLCGPTRDLVTTLQQAGSVGLPIPRIRIVTNDARARKDPGGPRYQRYVVSDGWLPSSLDELSTGSGPPLGAPAVLVEPLDSSRIRILVTGDSVAGGPAFMASACRELARMNGTEVCEVILAHAKETGRLVCIGVSSLPSLPTDDHVAALADYLKLRAHSHTSGSPQ